MQADQGDQGRADAARAEPTDLTVEELWRYPVKSMGGERLATAEIGELGIDGDRRWGVIDRETGRLLTGRREPALLMARARHLGPGEVEITLPDGRTIDGASTTAAAELSDWLGHAVALVPSSSETIGPVFEVPDPDEQDWGAYDAAEGAWHDSPRARLSLVSRATIGEWDPRRFRSNLLLTGGGEDDLVGRTLRVGTTSLTVPKGIGRCVMVTRPQPGIEADRSVLRTILDERGGTLAIGALVTTPGRIGEGDPVLLSGGAAPPAG